MMNGDNRRKMDKARDVSGGVIPAPKGRVKQITAVTGDKQLTLYKKTMESMA